MEPLLEHILLWHSALEWTWACGDQERQPYLGGSLTWLRVPLGPGPLQRVSADPSYCNRPTHLPTGSPIQGIGFLEYLLPTLLRGLVAWTGHLPAGFLAPLHEGMDTHLIWHSLCSWHCDGQHLISPCRQPWERDVVPPNLMGRKLDYQSLTWPSPQLIRISVQNHHAHACFNYKRWASCFIDSRGCNGPGVNW